MTEKSVSLDPRHVTATDLAGTTDASARDRLQAAGAPGGGRRGRYRGNWFHEVKDMLPMLRYSPVPSFVEPFFGRLGSLRNEIDRWFDSTLSQDLFAGVIVPAMDIQETDDSLKLRFDVPGVKPEDLSVTFENGVLTISGEKKLEQESGDEKAGVRTFERSYGRFERSVTLPRTVDPDKVTASCEHGVLTVELPKTAEARPRKIEISRGSENRQIGSGQAQAVEV